MTGRTGAKGGRRRCPVCHRPTVDACRPFCSRRCAEIDLGRWLQGVYVLPGETPAARDHEPSDPDTGQG